MGARGREGRAWSPTFWPGLVAKDQDTLIEQSNKIIYNAINLAYIVLYTGFTTVIYSNRTVMFHFSLLMAVAVLVWL